MNIKDYQEFYEFTDDITSQTILQSIQAMHSIIQSRLSKDKDLSTLDTKDLINDIHVFGALKIAYNYFTPHEKRHDLSKYEIKQRTVLFAFREHEQALKKFQKLLDTTDPIIDISYDKLQARTPYETLVCGSFNNVHDLCKIKGTSFSEIYIDESVPLNLIPEITIHDKGCWT